MPASKSVKRPEAAVPLAPLTTLEIGGPAQWFLRAGSPDEVEAAHRWCRDNNVALFPLGGGSNLVIADSGINALVLQISIRGRWFGPRRTDTVVRVGAGEPWDALVAAAVSHGLAGLECLSGIPGNVGGTPIQNVGAYGQEVSETIVDVTAFDTTAGQLTTLGGAECGFGYRTSRFKRQDAGRFIVCDVTFALRDGPPTLAYPDVINYVARANISSPTLDDVRGAVLAIRRTKGMVLDEADVDTRSVGSFFTNPVVPASVQTELADHIGGPVPGFPVGANVKIPAAWLIEHAGFARGHQHGRVGLSSKHPLAIINRGGATARDVLNLAVLIKRTVADRFGISLVPEPVFIGFGDDADVAYLTGRPGG